MHSHPLSKSKLAAFAQCPKRLWLEVHRPELAASEDAREARLGTQEVFEEACRQCAGGVAVAGPDLTAALAATAVLVAAEAARLIIGAALEHEGVWVRCDLLAPDGAGGWRLVAVTSSTRAKDHHRASLATQLWVARGAGVAVSDATIRHIDPAFVLAREGDYAGVFADHDRDPADDLRDEVAAVPALVAGARATLAGPEPDVTPGGHCSSAFECAFSDHCHAALSPGPEWPVDLLPRGGGARWRAAGISDLLAVDPDQLGVTVRRVHAATISGVPDHDPAGAAAAMAAWPFPRIWLDFGSGRLVFSISCDRTSSSCCRSEPGHCCPQTRAASGPRPFSTRRCSRFPQARREPLVRSAGAMGVKRLRIGSAMPGSSHPRCSRRRFEQRWRIVAGTRRRGARQLGTGPGRRPPRTPGHRGCSPTSSAVDHGRAGPCG